MAAAPVGTNDSRRLQPSPREQQLIELASQGYSDKEAALLLGLSRDTVQTYWKRLKAKYNVSSRAQLVATLFGQTAEEFLPVDHGALDQLAAILDTLPEAVLIEDLEGNIATVNQAFCDLFVPGVPPGALRGANCRDALQSSLDMFEDGEAVVRSVQIALANRTKEREVPIRLADGRLLLRCYDPLFSGDHHVGNYWRYWVGDHCSCSETSPILPEPLEILRLMPKALLWFDRSGHLEWVNSHADALFTDLRGKMNLTFEQVFAASHFVRLRRSFRETQTNSVERSVLGHLDDEAALCRFQLQPHQGGVLVHVRELEDDRAALRQRIHYLKLHDILGKVLVDLIGSSPEEARSALHRLCYDLADYFGADHCSIQGLDASGRPNGTSVSWVKGFADQPLTLSFAADIPGRDWWAPRLQNDHFVLLTDVEDAPPGLCGTLDLLKSAGLSQAIVIPLRLHAMVVGCVLLTVRTNFRRQMSAQTEPALEILSSGLGRALSLL